MSLKDRILKEKELTSAERKELPSSAFVFPEERKYPIHDISHARNALARVSQHGTTEEQKKVRTAVEAKYPELKEELKMTGEQYIEAFRSEVIESFKDKLQHGKYELEEGYGGRNLQERVMGGGSPLAPYQHGSNMLKGPKAKHARPKGATWDYNPVDVRPDLKHRNPAPDGTAVSYSSPTPKGVPVDVRPDTMKKRDKLRRQADSYESPTKKGWPGTRMESQSQAATLLENIEKTTSALFG